MDEPHKRRYAPIIYFIGVAFILLCALEVFAIFFWGTGIWNDKLSAFFALVGAYGIAIGFFAKSKVLEPFHDTLTELTSPHPVEYLVGNFRFATYPMLIGAVAMSKYTLPGGSRLLKFLGTLIWFAISPILIVYVFAHLTIIAPLAYFPILIASAVLSRIEYSGEDCTLERVAVENHTSERSNAKVSIKKIVTDNPIAAKGFIMGVPSVFIAIIGKVVSAIL